MGRAGHFVDGVARLCWRSAYRTAWVDRARRFDEGSC